MTHTNGKFNAGYSPENGSSSSPTVNEASIEKYVRFGVMLSEAEKLRIEQQLEDNKSLRTIAEFYESFYELYDEIEEKPAPGVDNFVASLYD